MAVMDFEFSTFKLSIPTRPSAVQSAVQPMTVDCTADSLVGMAY